MRRPADHQSLFRAQRGTVVRGVLVLAALVGAVALQSTTPAWQSRLDAAAAFVGITSAVCQKPGATAHGSSAPVVPGTGWHDGKPSLVAGASGAAGAHPGARINAAGMVAPAGVVAPAI